VYLLCVYKNGTGTEGGKRERETEREREREKLPVTHSVGQDGLNYYLK
jgi:hypothetical protein